MLERSDKVTDWLWGHKVNDRLDDPLSLCKMTATDFPAGEGPELGVPRPMCQRSTVYASK
jgi:hypothetical protein